MNNKIYFILTLALYFATLSLSANVGDWGRWKWGGEINSIEKQKDNYQDIVYNGSVVGTTEFLTCSFSHGNPPDDQYIHIHKHKTRGGGWIKAATAGNDDKSCEVWYRHVTADNVNDKGQLNVGGAGSAKPAWLRFNGIAQVVDVTEKLQTNGAKIGINSNGPAPYLIVAASDNGTAESDIAKAHYAPGDDRVFIYLTNDSTFQDNTTGNLRGAIASLALVEGGLANEAEFVSQNVPDVMNPGETQTVDITLRNTGEDAWSLADGHSLGAQNPQDNTVWRALNRVSVSGAVAPDTDAVFSFDITAPSNPGLYNFQWQMVDESGENTGWFGDETPYVLINVGNLYDSTSNPGSITDNGVSVPAAETSDKVFDDDVYTKFLSFSSSAYIQYRYADNVQFPVVAYSLTSANDHPSRDPVNVTLKGSNDESNWTTLDSQTGIVYKDRFDKAAFNINNSTFYEYYRIEMSTGGEAILQLAEIELLTPGNFAPVITSSPTLAIDETVAYSYTMTATDPDGDPVFLSAAILPEWLSFNDATGLLSGTPANTDIGSHAVALRASDGVANADHIFTIIVSSLGNDDPTIDSTPNHSAIENQLYTYTLEASDVDGDTLTFSHSLMPSWLSLDPLSGVLSGTPSSSDAGLNPVSLTVEDGQGGSDIQEFNIAVFAPSEIGIMAAWDFTTVNGTAAPAGWTSWAGGSGSSSVVGGLTLTHNSGGTVVQESTPGLITESGTPLLSANEAVLNDYMKLDGDPASFTLSGLPAGQEVRLQFTAHCLTSTAGTRNLTVRINGGTARNLFSPGGTTGGYEATYSPHFSFTGTGSDISFVFTQVNNGSATGISGMIIEGIGMANTAPLIVSPPKLDAEVDVEYSYVLQGEDAEGDPLTFIGLTIPSWLTLDPLSGRLSGTPTAADFGDNSVSIQLSDSADTDVQNFTITVNDTTSISLQAWMDLHSVTDIEADDDGDGFSNLMEYALDGDPNIAESELQPRVLKNGAALEIIFKRSRAGVTYTVEKSSDLSNWSDHAAVNDSHGLAGESVIVPVSLSEMSGGKLFLRLKVEN